MIFFFPWSLVVFLILLRLHTVCPLIHLLRFLLGMTQTNQTKLNLRFERKKLTLIKYIKFSPSCLYLLTSKQYNYYS